MIQISDKNAQNHYENLIQLSICSVYDNSRNTLSYKCLENVNCI